MAISIYSIDRMFFESVIKMFYVNVSIDYTRCLMDEYDWRYYHENRNKRKIRKYCHPGK